MPQPIKIWRSPFSHAGKLLKQPDDLLDETVTALKAYTDKQLSEIAENGFNAIWIYGLLRNIVESDVFPEFGEHFKVHQNNMQKLIERAALYGLRVFILMQPPRALDVEDPFWKRHPEAGGQETDFQTDDGFFIRMRSLCTSTQAVKDYLYNSSAELARVLPGLGGIILITASEFPSHCYGKLGTLPDSSGNLQTGSIQCSRCSKYSPAEIISEIIHLIRNGIRTANEELDIIVWNWSWNAHYPPPCNEIIRLLPDDVIVMTGFERGGKKKILGEDRIIDEYSLSYSGPSRQFLDAMESLRIHKLRMMVKLQIGTTHELATVPNLPLIGNLYNKARVLRKHRITDFLGCWSFGNMISVNTRAFNYFMSAASLPDKQTALASFAQNYFPGCRTDRILKAWNSFESAMDSYPFSTSFLYSGPLNYALAYPLAHKKVSPSGTGRSWVMDERGDNLEASLTEFDLDEVISGLETLGVQWENGLRFLREGLKDTDTPEAEKEINSASASLHIFRSGLNIYKAYRLNRNWKKSQVDEYLKIVRDERDNLQAVLPIISRDRRLGFHSEAQAYMFTPSLIQKKITDLQNQLNNKGLA